MKLDTGAKDFAAVVVVMLAGMAALEVDKLWGGPSFWDSSHIASWWDLPRLASDALAFAVAMWAMWEWGKP